MLGPPQSLHLLLMRWCSQMLDPPQSLHLLLRRWCSLMADPPQSLHLLLSRLCSQSLRFCAPPCAEPPASVALRLRSGPSMLQLQPVTAPAPKGLPSLLYLHLDSDNTSLAPITAVPVAGQY